MVESAVGTKELKEVVVGANEVAVTMIELFKDGVQFGDFTTFWSKLQTEPEFKAKLQAAYENIAQLPAEIKDIDMSEGVELAVLQLSYLPKIIAAIKKEVAVG